MIQTIILFIAVLLLSFCIYSVIIDIIKAIYNINKNYKFDDKDNYYVVITIITAICLTYILWYCN